MIGARQSSQVGGRIAFIRMRRSKGVEKASRSFGRRKYVTKGATSTAKRDASCVKAVSFTTESTRLFGNRDLSRGRGEKGALALARPARDSGLRACQGDAGDAWNTQRVGKSLNGAPDEVGAQPTSPEGSVVRYPRQVAGTRATRMCSLKNHVGCRG